MKDTTNFSQTEIDAVVYALVALAKEDAMKRNAEAMAEGRRVNPEAYKSSLAYSAVCIIEQQRQQVHHYQELAEASCAVRLTMKIQDFFSRFKK